MPSPLRRDEDERDVVTIRDIALIFALAISGITIIGIISSWPLSVIMFDLFLVVFGVGVIVYIIIYHFA